MRNSLGIAVLAAVAGAACGVNDAAVGSSDETQGGAALSTTSRTYVTMRKDKRACASPLCGGWFVADVNRATLTERYVNSLDFSTSGLDDATAAVITGAADGEVVLRGKLGAAEALHQTRSFVVSEAYRGMPGQVFAATDVFYRVAPLDLECIVAPCPSQQATKLNATATTNYEQNDVSAASSGFVDGAWLSSRITDHGAIVVGAFVQGVKVGTKHETNLAASQVFIRVPDAIGPCPQHVLACSGGQIATYTRDENRCKIPSACVTPHVCPHFLPACESGYTLVTMTGALGCNTYFCDPSFSAP